MFITNARPSPIPERGISAALGYFEGMHLAHRAIIQETEKSGMVRAVISFSPSPRSYFHKEAENETLLSYDDRIDAFDKLGLDYVFIHVFDEDFASMSPEAFVQNCLYDYGIREVSVGFNFTFGKNASGNAETLRQLCSQYLIKVNIFEPITYSGEVVSSSLIKEKIRSGDVASAAVMFSHPYSVEGTVRKGKQLGRTLGFPTANLELAVDYVIPATGVYETKTVIDGKLLPSITNVGYNPTVESGNPLSIETHIIDYDRDFYGEKIKVAFYHRIRPEKKFSGLDELKSQVLSDIDYVRRHTT
jgi:riboflavin kinase/FMN adenylyltransferase